MSDNEVIVVISLAVLLVFTACYAINVNAASRMDSMEFDCNLGPLEVINVSPSKCWNDNFDSEFCPVLENIKCSGKISGRFNLVDIEKLE